MSTETITYTLDFPHFASIPTQAQFEQLLRIVSYNGGTFDELLAQLDEKTSSHVHECHITGTRSKERSGERGVWVYELSCGHIAETVDIWPPDYCSYCGAKIVTEE